MLTISSQREARTYIKDLLLLSMCALSPTSTPFGTILLRRTLLATSLSSLLTIMLNMILICLLTFLIEFIDGASMK